MKKKSKKRRVKKRRPFLNRYLVPFLRRIFRWSPAYREVRKHAQVGRNAKKQQCAKCLGIFNRDETHVDHIVPVGSQPPSVSWEQYIQNFRYEDAAALQVLCVACHKQKTEKDRARGWK